MFGGRTSAYSSQRRTERATPSCDCILYPGEEPPLASHLVTPRTLYSHHGIYVGNGRVIHYAGLAHGWRYGPVEDVPLARFAHGRSVRVRHEERCFDRQEVVERARSRLGEHRYDILRNNCEHFCAWALRDEYRSKQVEKLRAAAEVIYRAVHAQHELVTRTIGRWRRCFASD